MDCSFDEFFMQLAIEQAKLAADVGEIPVGAVLIDRSGAILSAAHNLCETHHSPVSHAEMLAVDEVCRQKKSWRLSDCTIYVTLEPCPMCMGALIRSRIGRVVYGAADARAGACGSLIDLTSYPLESRPSITSGVLAEESLDLLRSFFKRRRTKSERSDH